MLCGNLGWDNHPIGLHKIRIQALLGQSPDCLRARPHTTKVVHLYVQSFSCVHVRWFVYVGWKIAHHQTFEKWTKETFLSGKKVGSKLLLLLNKVTIDFQSRLLCCAFSHFALYTSPSTIDFWPQFLCCTFPCTSTFTKFLAYCIFLINRLLAYNTVRW